MNIWKDDPATVADSYARIEAAIPAGSCSASARATPRQRHNTPARTANLARTSISCIDHGVPAEGIVLAALGPRVLRLAADRTAGAIPYLVPPEHTSVARAILGPDRLLAPEHKVVVDADPERARALGRKRVSNPYLHLVNYTSNLRRLGFTDEELADGGSDRLIDAVVAQGSAEQVATQLSAHLDAGADHVCIQLLTEADTDPLPGYAELAHGLGLAG